MAKYCSQCGAKIAFRNSFTINKQPVCGSCMIDRIGSGGKAFKFKKAAVKRRKDVKNVEIIPENTLKNVQVSPKEDIKKAAGLPKEKIKNVTLSPNEDVKKVEVLPREKIKNVQVSPKEDVKKVEVLPKEKINNIQVLPKEDVKKVERLPKEKVKNIGKQQKDKRAGKKQKSLGWVAITGCIIPSVSTGIIFSGYDLKGLIPLIAFAVYLLIFTLLLGSIIWSVENFMKLRQDYSLHKMHFVANFISIITVTGTILLALYLSKGDLITRKSTFEEKLIFVAIIFAVTYFSYIAPFSIDRFKFGRKQKKEKKATV